MERVRPNSGSSRAENSDGHASDACGVCEITCPAGTGTCPAGNAVQAEPGAGTATVVPQVPPPAYRSGRSQGPGTEWAGSRMTEASSSIGRSIVGNSSDVASTANDGHPSAGPAGTTICPAGSAVQAEPVTDTDTVVPQVPPLADRSRRSQGPGEGRYDASMDEVRSISGSLKAGTNGSGPESSRNCGIGIGKDVGDGDRKGDKHGIGLGALDVADGTHFKGLGSSSGTGPEESHSRGWCALRLPRIPVLPSPPQPAQRGGEAHREGGPTITTTSRYRPSMDCRGATRGQGNFALQPSKIARSNTVSR